MSDARKSSTHCLDTIMYFIGLESNAIVVTRFGKLLIVRKVLQAAPLNMAADAPAGYSFVDLCHG